MKILKPDSLALLYRSCHLVKENYLAIGMLAFFNLDNNQTTDPLPEIELWPAVAEALGDAGILDDGHAAVERRLFRAQTRSRCALNKRLQKQTAGTAWRYRPLL